MSRSSISSSSPATPVAEAAPSRWSRILRDVLLLFGILILLELVLRLEPIHAALAPKLDPYAHLLAYDLTVPAYQNQLLAKPGYDVWLLGSSYMMTGLDPHQIQSRLPDDVTVQNYGFSSLRNFAAMGSMVDWLLTFDQPRYVVVGISRNNFTGGAGDPVPAQTSPYENMFIFRDSIDDVVSGFLFNNSFLYRYGILARNAGSIPFENTVLKPIPEGGYTPRDNSNDECVPNYALVVNEQRRLRMADGLERLDQLLNTIQAHHLPVMVVNLPIPVCSLSEFASFASYQTIYIDALADHLAEKDVPFIALDEQFYAEIPLEEQGHYFADGSHPNVSGSALFSTWAGDFIAEWLQQQEN